MIEPRVQRLDEDAWLLRLLVPLLLHMWTLAWRSMLLWQCASARINGPWLLNVKSCQLQFRKDHSFIAPTHKGECQNQAVRVSGQILTGHQTPQSMLVQSTTIPEQASHAKIFLTSSGIVSTSDICLQRRSQHFRMTTPSCSSSDVNTERGRCYWKVFYWLLIVDDHQ